VSCCIRAQGGRGGSTQSFVRQVCSRGLDGVQWGTRGADRRRIMYGETVRQKALGLSYARGLCGANLARRVLETTWLSRMGDVSAISFRRS